jgi:DNA topoisomerase-2
MFSPAILAYYHARTSFQVTGGRNGYGAKLANIFSTKFTVETCDGKRRRRYKQTFTNNMSKKTEPVITCA